MSRKSITFLSLIVVCIAALALTLYRVKHGRQNQKLEPNEAPIVADSTQHTDYEMADEYKIVEAAEPPELKPESWTLREEHPLSLPDHVWNDADRPGVKDIPDTLQWNYFRNQDRRDFSPKEKELLAAQGCFLEKVPADSFVSNDDMIDIYSSHQSLAFGKDYSTVPLFITTDFLLHVYHVVFDRALQQAEEREIYFAALRLSDKMLKSCINDLRETPDGEIREAIKGNLAFFSIACGLLDTAFVPPPEVQAVVNSELELIIAARSPSTSPLFRTEEDYTQFIPRGHYTKTPRLGRYFRAMMWYGRMRFLANSEHLTLMAIHQSLILSDPKMDALWKSIADPLTYLVGTADDLSYHDYVSIIHDQYGSGRVPKIGEFADGKRLADFIQRASTLRRPKISDHPLPNRLDPESQILSYRFLGQHFTPDAEIFTRLTSPRVGSDDRPRNMPTAMDVMSVFGSKSADDLLLSESNVPNYTASLGSLKAEYAGYPDATWTQSIYWRWLASLKQILKAKDDRYPYFMRTSNWGRKSLLTAVSSWSELKHDTILLSKQSNAEMGEGEEEPPPLPPQPKSYVEPDLEFFNLYVDLIQKTAKVFSDNQLLSAEYLQKFGKLFSGAVWLRDIVRKELLDAEISHQDYEDLIGFAGSLSWTVIPEGSGDMIDYKYKQMALVSDVHTDSFDQLALEEGVGAPQRIYVAVKDNSGGCRVCVGYVYSYYEFSRPISERMTDDEWKALVYGGDQRTLQSFEPKWIPSLRIQQ